MSYSVYVNQIANSSLQLDSKTACKIIQLILTWIATLSLHRRKIKLVVNCTILQDKWV